MFIAVNLLKDLVRLVEKFRTIIMSMQLSYFEHMKKHIVSLEENKATLVTNPQLTVYFIKAH